MVDWRGDDGWRCDAMTMRRRDVRCATCDDAMFARAMVAVAVRDSV